MLQKMEKKGEVMFSRLLLSLGCHSEQGGDKYHLAENISFASPSHLSFLYHVYRLKSLQGSPCRLERKKPIGVWSNAC